jgi:large subunit ribosomal protein L24
MKIKKGDNVIVIAGKDRGRKGKVLTAYPKLLKVVVEGMNIHKKNVRPKQAGQKGQIVEMPGAFSASNVQLICDKCGKGVRVGYKKTEGAKARVCKKCGIEI